MLHPRNHEYSWMIVKYRKKDELETPAILLYDPWS